MYGMFHRLHTFKCTISLQWVKTFKVMKFRQMGWLLGLLGTASQTKNIQSLRKKRSGSNVCFKRNNFTSSALTSR